MLRSLGHSMLPVFCLLLLGPANMSADEPKAVATARLLMQVIDSVTEHHIEALTRQQMVLEIILHFAAEEKKSPPPGLSRRISSVDPDNLGTLLAEELSKYIEEGDSPTSSASLLDEIAEFFRFSDVSITSLQDHRVQEQMAGNRYVGIGVAVGMHQPTKQLQFLSIFPGGAAAKAGLKVNDIVETVDGQMTKGQSLNETINLLRGEEGTDVTIIVRQPDEKESREFTLTRAIVPFKTIKDPVFSDNHRVAVIGFERSRGITGSSVHDLRQIEAELPETVETVTLDFRRLSERNLHHGILLANALLDGEPIGQIETTDGVRTVTAERGTLFGNRKLVILIDGYTQGTPLWIAASVAEAGHEVIGEFASDGLVFDAVPLTGTDFVVSMPTARLRRVDGKPLALDQGRPSATEYLSNIRRRRAAAGAPRLINQPELLSFPFEDLGEAIFRLYLKNSDQPKE
ncbi:MAG: PDZ domain-containing protein [Planctomycetaceae bacterium]|nr:PDZ domain-containing protein [Planctomycetaceae bacterium]